MTSSVKAVLLIALGLAIAAMLAAVLLGVRAPAPLFARSPDVPSVIDSAPSPQSAGAVERVRGLGRVAVLEQNLPGVPLGQRMRIKLFAGRFGLRLSSSNPIVPLIYSAASRSPYPDPRRADIRRLHSEAPSCTCDLIGGAFAMFP